MKAKKLFAGVLAAALVLASCQANPEGSIVVHKNMENLISEAQTESEGKSDAGTIREEVQTSQETYRDEIVDESFGVTVRVDAEVEVPKTDHLSVYRVRRGKIDQAFFDRVRETLLGETPIYDVHLIAAETKRSIEEQIASCRAQMQSLEENLRTRLNGAGEPLYSEEELAAEVQQQTAILQVQIDDLQAAYEAAPEEADPNDYPTDGKIHTMAELHQMSPEWYPLNGEYGEDDERLLVVTDGKDGRYAQMQVENLTEIRSALSYRAASGTYLWSPATDEGTVLVPNETVAQNKNAPENYLGVVMAEDAEFEPMPGESCTITQEAALEQAEALLREIGLDGFALEEGGRFNEGIPLGTTRYTYMPCYIFRFRRSFDGVLLTQSTGTKHDEIGSIVEEQEGDDVYRSWPGECVEVRVNDNGIVGFDYLSPVEVVETVTENAALKSFSEIKESFRQMIPIVNATENLETALTVDRVRLTYSRISEQDSYDTGLVVPVWSFEGSAEVFDPANGRQSRWTDGCVTLLAVNAIDGSVIDGELGY